MPGTVLSPCHSERSEESACPHQRFFATLRMTVWGLGMTVWGLGMTAPGLRHQGFFATLRMTDVGIPYNRF